MPIRAAANILALCATSALAGAMLLIWQMPGNFWRSREPGVLLDWFAAFGPMIGPVTVSLAALGTFGLVGSLWLDWTDRRTRLLWAAALVCLGGVGWITFAFEAPLNAVFEIHAVPSDRAEAALNSGLNWHFGRVLLGFCAAGLGASALVRRMSPAAAPGPPKAKFYATEDMRRAIRGA